MATQPSADSVELLKGYVREALRLDPVLDGVYRAATVDNSIGPVDFKKGEKLWFDFRAAGADPRMFEDPTTVDPARPAKLYTLLHGDGVFKVLGEDFVYGVAAEVLRAVFSLPGVRRAKGPAGTLRRFKEVVHAPLDEVEAVKSTPAPTKTAAQLTQYAESHPADYGEEPADPSTSGYKWKEVDGDRAWRWVYVNPEDSNRLTAWATGLTVYVSSFASAVTSQKLIQDFFYHLV